MVHEITLASASAFSTSILSRTRRRHAQTFPEMMIVVAIIAILAAVIMANLFHARIQAQISTDMQAEQQIANALEMYHNDYGVYPPSGDGNTAINSAQFGGIGNPYYNTSQTNPPPLNNNLQQPYQFWIGSPDTNACFLDPCNYLITQWCSSIDGGDLPSSLLDYDGSTPVKGTLYAIEYQIPQGFFVASAAQNGC